MRIPVGGGFAGRIAAGRRPIYIADVDHAEILNPILRMKGVRSLLGVPLLVEGATLGVLHVGTVTPREFTNADAALLQLAAAQAAPAIDRARLFDALDREHRSAVALQRSLLPDRVPDLVGIETAARYLPARDEVGGDWYDVIDLPGGHVGIAIGDVAGHGLRAAALMGQLRAGLRAYALDGRSPGDTLKRLDRMLQTISGRGMATAAYAVVDPATGSLTYASAGHPPPVIVRGGRDAQLLAVTGAPPLGSLPFSTFPECQDRLASNDTIMLYTDGLIERRHESLTTGLERLRALAATAITAEDLCRRVVAELVPAGGAEDDIAIVALRIAPVEATLRVRFAADPQVLSQMRRMLGPGCASTARSPTRPPPSSSRAARRAPTRSSTRTLPASPTSSSRRGTRTARDADRPRRQPVAGAAGGNRGRGLKMIAAAVDELDLRTTDAGTEVVMHRRLRPR